MSYFFISNIVDQYRQPNLFVLIYKKDLIIRQKNIDSHVTNKIRHGEMRRCLEPCSFSMSFLMQNVKKGKCLCLKNFLKSKIKWN